MSSSRHTTSTSGTPKGSPSVASDVKGSQRSTRTQEPLDDQLTDWWSDTVLGGVPNVGDDSMASLGWELTPEDEIPPLESISIHHDDSDKRNTKSTSPRVFYFDSPSTHSKKQECQQDTREN